VEITMTLTAPGCGMGPVIQNDVEKAVRALQGVAEVCVELVLDPPWSREHMSEVAKLQLGLY
jgi:metal-sulfur cluster biosynthetic enzyme